MTSFLIPVPCDETPIADLSAPPCGVCRAPASAASGLCPAHEEAVLLGVDAKSLSTQPPQARCCELCGLPEDEDDEDSHLSLAGNDSVSTDDRILVCNRRTCRPDF